MRSVTPIRATPRRSKPSRRRPATADLADTAIVVVTGTDPDGDAIARPVTWDAASGSAAGRSSWQPNRAAGRRWRPANACWPG